VGCAPKYFQRSDVLVGLGLAIAYGTALGWSAMGDGDQRRTIGAAASAGLAVVFASTLSIPLLAAPFAIAGAFRLPRATKSRWLLLMLILAIVLLTIALIRIGSSGLTSDQIRCP
jgi:hypothetical protein